MDIFWSGSVTTSERGTYENGGGGGVEKYNFFNDTSWFESAGMNKPGKIEGREN